jgi:hypothetical protein
VRACVVSVCESGECGVCVCDSGVCEWRECVCECVRVRESVVRVYVRVQSVNEQ